MTRHLLLAACAALLLAGESAPSANPLDQAEVVLRVRDGRWVDREATRFAAAFGGDLAKVRGELARVLYRSRSFDGIDLGRPAVVAWRAGDAPLLVAIPLSNRTQFLAAFGATDPGDAPLVRTGERDGTVIYKQNQSNGEWEYRLLVANNVAYLARTAAECRQLAAAIGSPSADPFAAPIEVTLRHGAVRAPRLPGASWLSDLPALPIDLAELAGIPGLLDQGWAAVADQVEALNITARSDTRGNLELSLRLAAASDSNLATWVSAQRPSTERLAGQLRQPDTAVLVSGRLAFQGQFERWAFDQAETLRAAAGVHWTDTADAAYRTFCTLVERTGAFALAVERSNTARLQQWVAEHPRAVEVMQSTAAVGAALRGLVPTPAQLGRLPALTYPLPDGGSVFVAGDRHAMRVDDHGAKRGAAAAADAVRRLDEPGSLDAAPSLMSLWIDLALAWNAPPLADGLRADPVVVQGTLRPAGQGLLELGLEVPLAELGKLLGRLNPNRVHD